MPAGNRQNLQDLKPESLRHRVIKVLDGLRPLLQQDGGDVELVDIRPGGIVRVRLLGSCVGCPSSNQTLVLGIERNLRDALPQITRVVSVE